MRKLPLYEGCFVCGDRNPAGLEVAFYLEGEEARGEFTPDSRWEGYPGVVHGGILSALLDEVMYKAVVSTGELTMTAEITVRFRIPARVGVPLLMRGRVTGRKGRLLETQGEIEDAAGRRIATAAGKFIVLAPPVREHLLEAVEGRVHE